MKKFRDSSSQFGPWKFQNQYHLEDLDKVTKKLKPVKEDTFNLPKMANPRAIGSNSALATKISYNPLSKREKKPIEEDLPQALKTKEYCFNAEDIAPIRHKFPGSYRKANKKMRQNFEELYLSQRLQLDELENREKQNQTKIRLIDRLKIYKKEEEQEEQQQKGDSLSYYCRNRSLLDQRKDKKKEMAKKRSLIDLVKYLKRENQRNQLDDSPAIHQNQHQRFFSLSEQEIKIPKNEPSLHFENPQVGPALRYGIFKANLPTFSQKKTKINRKR